MITVDEKSFEQEVLDSSVPVIVHFWAPWCGVCRLINPILTQFQNRGLGPCKVVNVNADENFKLATTYRLTTLPTLLVLRGGEVCDRIEGFRAREEFQRALEGVSGTWSAATAARSSLGT